MPALAPVCIAIDAGTTGVRAVVVDHRARVLDVAYRELTQYFPRPGWVEHDPTEIWSHVRSALAEVTGRLAGRNLVPETIGITNQRETVAAWDRATGLPRHRAIVWQDRRTATACQALEQAGHLPLIRARTGLVLDPYFSASKMQWLLTEGGVEWTPTLALGTVDSWVLWNLTGGPAGGVFATDVTNASRTMLFDIVERRWSEALCDLFGVPEATLATVRPSSCRFGQVSDALLGRDARRHGLPVSGIAGDQHAALFGQACFDPGMTKVTLGTGSFVLLNAGPVCPEPVDGLITTVAWDLGRSEDDSSESGTGHSGGATSGSRVRGDLASGDPASGDMASGGTTSAGRDPVAYALEGSVFASGAGVQWLRDGLGIIEKASDLEPLARTVASSDGVTIVPAFTGLGSPYWDPRARGMITGLSRGSGRAHLARAMIEAMGFQVDDVVRSMAGASLPPSLLRVDGGASVMDLLLQLVADQTGLPVVRPRSVETTAIGAATLAGLAEGVWGSLDELGSLWEADTSFSPAASSDPGSSAGSAAPSADITDTTGSAAQAWMRAVDRSRHWTSEP